MTFDPDAIVELVTEFCRQRRVEAASRIRIVDNLDAAFEVVRLKGPDVRWKTIVSRPCAGDLTSPILDSSRPAERIVYDHTLLRYHKDGRQLPHQINRQHPWWLSHVVVSTSHWARFSQTIRAARDHGLGWMIPAHKDVILVPKPMLRCLEESHLLHDDSGRFAVEWADGTGLYFLRNTHFDASLYFKVVNGALTLTQIADLANADQRSIALTYMTFDQLVRKSDARLLDIGVKGTSLYRLPLPSRIARDRVRGYGRCDYFIHMRDASHPEREFIEWVDPKIGAMRDAELCQAVAFGITLDQWLSIEQEG